MTDTHHPDSRFLARSDFNQLLGVLRELGYRCAGPQLRNGAIIYDDLEHTGQLPVGIRVEQSPGSYRVSQSDSVRAFAWSNGPQALKPLVNAPRETLWSATTGENGKLQFVSTPVEPAPLAVIGVRGCDLAGLALQDAHFLQTDREDPAYRARRAALLLVAVNCTHPSATCFCASTGDGPAASHGFDLVLDELDAGFILHSGSEAGARVLTKLDTRAATASQRAAAAEATTAAAAMQSRSLPAGDLYEPLMARQAHPHWQDIAGRCLSCGNCTSVCPTCFCSDVRDDWSVDGSSVTHGREWGSCFTQGHSYLHSHVVRPDTQARYRQWLTHKLGSWHRQYGRSGCVGCGRCISWCPTGIDITAEVRTLLDDTA
jgi:ferredoxin